MEKSNEGATLSIDNGLQQNFTAACNGLLTTGIKRMLIVKLTSLLVGEKKSQESKDIIFQEF